jgi:hypothetical protein
MDAVRKIIENSSNPLSIDLPKEYQNRKLEVIILPIEGENEKKNYDFADLAGQLEWSGDALIQQKKLRNEW